MFVPNRDEEIAELLDLGLSRSEIGRRLGIDHRRVSSIALRLGFRSKQNRPTKYDWLAVRRYYEEGHSAAATRRRFGISSGGWENAVERGDIKLRAWPASEPSRTRRAIARLLEEGKRQVEITTELGISKSTVAHHVRALGVPPDSRFSKRYDWLEIQRAYDAGLSPTECAARFGFSKATWSAAVRRGDLRARPVAVPLQELLVAGRTTNRFHLKARLIRDGVKKNRCEICGITEWNGKPLKMQLHHKNGDPTDNRLENLELLCANCHSQTENYAGRNGHRRRRAAGGTQRSSRTPGPIRAH